ncbi:MFS general substrate transporter [Dendrothele bispora CBS 962.96]|uniref:MFS general substrate transporter n=1 Tax=Dendrothele bispora (strain CBS 962.96) TaxID=1314807 RepID=A0A4S8MW52_DENBC|nr:MFS general substrate transporter [Dendrothele bispora CBS 962.96]
MSNQVESLPRSNPGEREPLLPSRPKKPFYRPRPLWLVPFAITGALVRGMTLAPRVEVFTQLSCADIHHHHNPYNHTNTPLITHDSHSLFIYSTLDPVGPHLSPIVQSTLLELPTSTSPAPPQDDDDDGSNENDPRRLPSQRCLGDPKVSARAARLQTIMTTTMGFLSALTTGWWGHFSERHGRTRVLALSTLGLFLTDLTFILVATPGSFLASHGHKLLIIAPIIEGSLGGWSTLQSATSSYVSDCTSPGSRAKIFSRFTGVFYLGFALGPTIGGWIIRNGIPGIDRIGTLYGQGKSVTEVFWLAICCSFINLLLVTFLFPESLSKEQRAKAAEQYHRTFVKGKGRATVVETNGDVNFSSGLRQQPLIAESSQHISSDISGGGSVILGFLSPLSMFLPVVVMVPTASGIKKTKDWSLTLLALSMFLFMLATGIYQIKYLYAGYVYGWGADKLSYYISFVGGLRAVCLLLLMPALISTFKPQTKSPQNKNKKNPKPTKAHFAREINFDLTLTRICILIDITSQFLVSISPSPTIMHPQMLSTSSSTAAADGQQGSPADQRSEIFFVLASSLSSFGAGFIPAVQSLALCIMQARQLLEGSRGEDGNGGDGSEEGAAEEAAADVREESVKPKGDSGIGKLFGALSVLQATGQMIIGPLLFGLEYSLTTARFPKAIFVTAGSILVASLVSASLIRSPLRRERGNKGKASSKKGNKRRLSREEEEERRGRSRVSKDLFGYGEVFSREEEEEEQQQQTATAGPSGL